MKQILYGKKPVASSRLRFYIITALCAATAVGYLWLMVTSFMQDGLVGDNGPFSWAARSVGCGIILALLLGLSEIGGGGGTDDEDPILFFPAMLWWVLSALTVLGTGVWELILFAPSIPAAVISLAHDVSQSF